MRKILSILFVVALLFMGVAITAEAAVTQSTGGFSGMGVVKTQVLVNDTGQQARTLVALTTIPAGKCVILGYSVTNTPQATTTTECMVAFRDAGTKAAGLDSTILGEDEAQSGESIPYTAISPGVGLKNGLVVSQGPGTIVTVYWMRVKA